MKGAESLLWVASGAAESRQLVEATAREFNLRVRFCASGEVVPLLRAERWDLVGIELGAPPDEGLALLKELHHRFPRVTVFGASADTNVATIRAVLAAGASDFLSLPLSRQELHKSLIKFTEVDVKPAASRGAGEVVTICGARGGLGATTVAVNLAVRLAALTRGEVALVDLDLQRGDVAAFLNLTPLQSLATIAGAHGELDEMFLSGTLTRHASGVFVLPAPAQIEEAELVGHDEVERVLGVLRGQFRYTVIDTARTITGATLAAFEQTDRLLVLTDLSVPGVRAAQRCFELLGRLKIADDRVELLVTHAIPGPVKLPEATRAIGKEPFLTIPRDEAVAHDAMNAGTPLNGDRPSGLVHSINELAARLAGTDGGRKAKRGHLLQRIFAKGSRP